MQNEIIHNIGKISKSCYYHAITVSMFGSSLPQIVCRRNHVLFKLFVFISYSSVQHCVEFFFCCSSPVYPMLLVSLDCPFSLPLRYTLTLYTMVYFAQKTQCYLNNVAYNQTNSQSQ